MNLSVSWICTSLYALWQELDADWLQLFRRQQHVHAQERLIDRLSTPRWLHPPASRDHVSWPHLICIKNTLCSCDDWYALDILCSIGADVMMGHICDQAMHDPPRFVDSFNPWPTDPGSGLLPPFLWAAGALCIWVVRPSVQTCVTEPRYSPTDRLAVGFYCRPISLRSIVWFRRNVVVVFCC